MTYEVWIHSRVRKYLDSLGVRQAELCIKSLMQLREDPLRKRPGCDIKKLSGERKNIYRLRVGKHRFIYIISRDAVSVNEAFCRERGYQ